MTNQIKALDELTEQTAKQEFASKILKQNLSQVKEEYIPDYQSFLTELQSKRVRKKYKSKLTDMEKKFGVIEKKLKEAVNKDEGK